MNMLCSKCKERMAVLFVAHMEEGEMKNKGLCLKCAKEMKIPQVEAIMDRMGITDDDIDAMSDQVAEWFGGDMPELDENFDLNSLKETDLFKNMLNASSVGEPADEDDEQEQPRNSSFGKGSNKATDTQEKKNQSKIANS